MNRIAMTAHRMAAGLVAMCLSAAPALAHHSFAMFNKQKMSTISGTVRVFEFTNPHVWLWLDVPGANNTVDPYGFESGGPSQYDRMGLGRTTFKTGQKVTIGYHPLADGRHGGQLVTATFANGDTLDMVKQVKKFSSGEVQ